MKTSLHQFSAFAMAFLVSATGLGAADASSVARASLASRFVETGFVLVDAAGPYVERGTWRVQVLAKLGQPHAVLPDGGWLYHGRAVAGTELRGSLVIRFQDGRVSQLALATTGAIAAWRGKSRRVPCEFVAGK